MRFEWDESKRRANLRKHGIDFLECDTVFDGLTFTMEDQRFPYCEQCHITLGILNRRVVVIAHTETEEVIEIISIRKALRHEEARYYQHSPFPKIQD